MRRVFRDLCAFAAVFATIAIGSCAPPSGGSVAIAPVEVARLVPGVDTLTIYRIVGRDTTESGIVVDRLRIESFAGRPAFRREFLVLDRGAGQSRYEAADDAASLQPLVHVARYPQGMDSIEFSPGRAKGIIRETGGPPSEIATRVPATIYGATSLDLVLRSAPLGPDWRMDIPVFIQPMRAAVPMAARVVRMEQIGNRRCWRVLVDFLGSPLTAWIDSTNRKLCQQLTDLGSGRALMYRLR